jgi:hypothetical protein
MIETVSVLVTNNIVGSLFESKPRVQVRFLPRIPSLQQAPDNPNCGSPSPLPCRCHVTAVDAGLESFLCDNDMVLDSPRFVDP